MESSVTRPAVDIATDKPRPGLGLLLAVLAVPGSTVAFDLPGGGFYIGLPLAVAAIVLGVRARRAGVGKTRSTAAVIVAGLCIAQMAIWTTVSALS
ncbi:MAG TPA: hypothetical protein VGF21_10060 [Thermoleophilaceae bacterium]|jgi:predicted methyltransferase